MITFLIRPPSCLLSALIQIGPQFILSYDSIWSMTKFEYYALEKKWPRISRPHSDSATNLCTETKSINFHLRLLSMCVYAGWAMQRCGKNSGWKWIDGILCTIWALISFIKHTKTSFSVSPVLPLKHIVNQPPAVHFLSFTLTQCTDNHDKIGQQYYNATHNSGKCAACISKQQCASQNAFKNIQYEQ